MKLHHPAARWAVTIALLMIAVLFSWSLWGTAPRGVRALIVGIWLVLAVVLVLSSVRPGPLARFFHAGAPRASRVTGGAGAAACGLMACFSGFLFRQPFEVTGAFVILAISFFPLLFRAVRPAPRAAKGAPEN